MPIMIQSVLSPFIMVLSIVLLSFSAALHAEDCNENGVDDAKDIAAGNSQDCQLDGIPDECQISGPLVYSYDLGTDATLTSDANSTLLLTRYFSVQSFGIIAGVEVAGIGLADEDSIVTAGLWLDPDGDGEPDDLQLVAEGSGRLGLTGSGRIEFAEPYDFNGDGLSFFVGVWVNDMPGFEMGVDTTSLARQSWVGFSTEDIDPEAVPGDVARLESICDGCNGDWAVRALGCDQQYCVSSSDVDGNDIPDDCQEDCNDNGLPDAYEVVEGLATDCNDSGVLDECEGYGDCNGDGLIDVCAVKPGSGIRATFWANRSLEGVPDSSSIQPDMDFDSAVSPPEHGYEQEYSIRYMGVLHPPVTGTYALRERSDEHFTLWINGERVLDENESASWDFVAGEPVYIRGEFSQQGGGHHLQVFWTPPGGVEEVIGPEYFSLDMDRDLDEQVDTCTYGDCNQDGIDNSYELDLLAADDCNSDGVPDRCQWEFDCDGNFLIDSCEYGNGLVGSYYLSDEPGEFSTLVVSRVDPQIAFEWEGGSPDELVTDDLFAVRWMGTIVVPDQSGQYQLIGYNVDDGFRLWFDGVKYVDSWSDSSGQDHVVNLNLEANSRHEIRIEYYEAGGNARVGLKWRTPGADESEFVPSENLWPMIDLDGDLVPDGCTPDCDGDGISDAVEIADGSAIDCNENGVPDECDLGYPEANGLLAYWRFEIDTGLDHDSGPNNLQATIGNGQASSDVPVSSIPRTGDDNISSFDNGGVGRMEVVDDGSLSLIGTRFTSEAWVQLDQLAPDAVNSSSRQWLFMKKNPTSDGRIEWAVLVQGGNVAESCLRGIFGKQGPYTGRELVFLAAVGSESGTEKWCVVSDLEITDNNWHHVSVGFDPNRNEVRFELDGELDIKVFSSSPTNPNSHPLCIGAHRNSEGNWNQQLKGRIDEVRIRRGVPSLDTMLDVPYEIVSEDANDNGVPDECKVADCPADFNNDGVVQADDLGILLVAWGAGSGPEDLDGNGEVNGADVGLFFVAWGSCP